MNPSSDARAAVSAPRWRAVGRFGHSPLRRLIVGSALSVLLPTLLEELRADEGRGGHPLSRPRPSRRTNVALSLVGDGESKADASGGFPPLFDIVAEAAKSRLQAVKSKLRGERKGEEEKEETKRRAQRLSQKELEEEQQRKAKEEEERQREKEAKEKEEAERRQKEMQEEEEKAVLRARQKARRPLNAFEERRVRRQVRSLLGGAQSQQDWFKPLRPEVKGQLDDAIKFFSDTMRVPAALIGSAALGMLFLPPFKWAFYKEEQQEKRFVAVWRLYVLLTAFTFCAELTVVLGTSNAHAQLLELGRSGLALEPTAMDLIMSHLEFEYLTCSLSFFGGVVAFMLATFCRVVAVFRFANSRRMPQEPELCAAIGGMMLSSLLWWLHLANVRIVEFTNIGAMVGRYMQLLLARMRLGEVGLVGYGAVFFGFVSFFSAGVLVLVPLCNGYGRRDLKQVDS